MDARLVLRADAVLDLALGLLLLAAIWDGLYSALDLPDAEPGFFAQLAGALLIAFSYLLWIAPRDVRLSHAVSAAAAVANALGVLLIGAWLAVGELDVDGLGSVLLAALGLVLAVFAALEWRIASKNVAALMIQD